MAYNQNGNVINITPTGLYAKPSGVNIPSVFANTTNTDNRIPGIYISGYAGYDVSSWPWHNKADDYQFRDDLSWVIGSHQLKMGGSWALYKKTQDLFGDTQGSFNFNGMFTGRPAWRTSSSAIRTPTPNSPCKITANGTTFLQPSISRTTGTLALN